MKQYRIYIWIWRRTVTDSVEFQARDDAEALDHVRKGYGPLEQKPLGKQQSGVTKMVRLDGRIETTVWDRTPKTKAKPKVRK